MKVSGSVLCSAIAACYLAVHLPFLAPSLEDIDSINFALGLRDFDVARHQPHPPGYPVYTALGRTSLAVVSHTLSPEGPTGAEALALALWSAVSGAIALVAAGALFRGFERASVTPGATTSTGPAPPTRADVAGVMLLGAAPLFWMSGLRPMSDLPGLAFALSAQALLLNAMMGRRYPGPAAGPPSSLDSARGATSEAGSVAAPALFLAAGAFLAGLGIGMRVQSVWLTLPLLAVVVLRHGTLRFARAARLALVAFAAGVLLWGAPLVAASGGPAQYIAALGSQAGEDFAWVDMLAGNPTPRRLAFVLYETFVLPWSSVALAMAAGAAAVIGAVAVAIRSRRGLFLASLAFGPYALFHILFQETLHVRYALPLLPPLAWMAARGVTAIGRPGLVLGGGLAAASLWVALPGTLAYAREAHPAFRAIAEMAATAPADRAARVYSHYSLRRPLQAFPPASVPVVEPARTNEWAPLIDYWRGGGTAPVWFLADPKRTDLALIDPQSRRDVRRYRWAAADRPELGGARPLGVDWYRFHQPGWFAGAGWSLTPELGGITRLAGNGVDRRPIDAFVRRRPDAMTAIVGARHLGAAPEGPIHFSLTVDGHEVDDWRLDPAVGPNVLRVVRLPAGALAGAGEYARLSIAARPARGSGSTPAVAVRQFDIQPDRGFLFAFDEGWHEEEYDNATGLRWRWSSGRSVLRVLPPQAVRIRLAAESPLRYFDEPPRVRVSVAGRVLAETRPSDTFEWTVNVSAEDARRADGLVVLETTPVYLPGVEEGTADARQLGLRLFEIEVTPVSP